MKISTKPRYALRALVRLYLLQQEKKGLVSLKEISKIENLSIRYLENIFTKLRAKGIVNSSKGKKGGFYLEKSPEEVTLYDLFEALEDNDFSLLDCLIEGCDVKQNCSAKKIWAKIDNELKNILSKYSLKDVLELETSTNDTTK